MVRIRIDVECFTYYVKPEPAYIFLIELFDRLSSESDDWYFRMQLTVD